MYMTPVQEACNAVTMLIPSAALLKFVSGMPVASRRIDLLLVGTFMHLPVSFTYHACVASGHIKGDAIIDSDLRRLDQTMQHVVGVIFAFCLSNSILFAAANVPMNVYAIAQLWAKQRGQQSPSNDGKRWRLVCASMIMYTLPIVWNRDWENYSMAACSAAVGGLMFVPRVNAKYLNGWGHSVFHAFMGIFVIALARSIAHSTVRT